MTFESLEYKDPVEAAEQIGDRALALVRNGNLDEGRRVWNTMPRKVNDPNVQDALGEIRNRYGAAISAANGSFFGSAHTDAASSEEAAKEVEVAEVSGLPLRVLEFIVNCGSKGFTKYKVYTEMPSAPPSRSQLNEIINRLTEGGLITVVAREKVFGRQGAKARIYRVTELGRRSLDASTDKRTTP